MEILCISYLLANALSYAIIHRFARHRIDQRSGVTDMYYILSRLTLS